MSNTTEKYGVVLGWALTSVIAEEAAEAAELASLCRYQSVFRSDPLRQTRFPVQESGLGLISSAAVEGTAYTGCQALVLRCLLTAASTRGLPALLERLPE